MTLPQWLLLVSGLLVLAVLLSVLSRRVNLPLTVVLAVLGFAASAVGGEYGVALPLTGQGFEEVLVFLFLPVLVFAAVLGLSTREFLRDLLPILVLATVALLVAAGLVGLAVHTGLGLPLATALLFGVLISATDPAAVVAVFQELGVPRRLLTLVEGESLLNDGVAVVAVDILLIAALGGQLSLAAGLAHFFGAFFGGLAIGALVGLAAGAALPWLDRLPAAALSLALAYGSFVLADDVFGFSGIMATVAAGLVLAALAPGRASPAVRAVWHELWGTLDYVVNALLFLFIGLAIDADLLVANLPAIALAVVVALAARAVAVAPAVTVLERFAGIPRVGLRNEAVLVWGGLRGGVALALALALPAALADRDTLVAMTGGLVLATLLINATTISPLVQRLGLHEPSRAERFLAAGARLSAIGTARQRLVALNMNDPGVEAGLEQATAAARAELERIELSHDEERLVVLQRGLSVERQTYQHLGDVGLVPPSVARTLLEDVEDRIDEALMGGGGADVRRRERPPHLNRLQRWLVARLPGPIGEDPRELSYAEAGARQLAAQRAQESLKVLERLPNISATSVRQASEAFTRWEREAVSTLAALNQDDRERRLRHRQAEALVRATASDALTELARVGVLPVSVARAAALGGAVPDNHQVDDLEGE